MSEPTFTIQISSKLVNQLANDSVISKKKTKKSKPKLSREAGTSQKSQPKQPSNDSEAIIASAAGGWPLQSPLHMPLQPSQSVHSELEAIRSTLKESENVMERLQKQEETLLKEVTERAKDLHDKEFKLPEPKPIPCLDQLDACKKCYNENRDDPLKCHLVVRSYANCANRIRQLVGAKDS